MTTYITGYQRNCARPYLQEYQEFLKQNLIQIKIKKNIPIEINGYIQLELNDNLEVALGNFMGNCSPLTRDQNNWVQIHYDIIQDENQPDFYDVKTISDLVKEKQETLDKFLFKLENAEDQLKLPRGSIVKTLKILALEEKKRAIPTKDQSSEAINNSQKIINNSLAAVPEMDK